MRDLDLYPIPPNLSEETAKVEALIIKFRDLVLFKGPPDVGEVRYELCVHMMQGHTCVHLYRIVGKKVSEFF